MIYEAMKASYDYTLRGDAVRTGLTAKQGVSFRHLNLEAIKKDAPVKIGSLLKEIVDTRSKSQVYDENDNYLESVTDEVYRKALSELLSRKDRYYTSLEMDVEVEYVNGKWRMKTTPELISAILGGTE